MHYKNLYFHIQSGFFDFSAGKVTSWNIRLQTFISANIKMFRFPKYKAVSWGTKFWAPRSKGALGSLFCKQSHRKCLTVFWICVGLQIFQGSEYAFSSKYAMVLNIGFLFVKIKKDFSLKKYKRLLQNRFLQEKIKETFLSKHFESWDWKV